MDDLYQLEYLALVAKIAQEILNHTGLDDKTLAEFVISLHEQSGSQKEFKGKLKEVGADFPVSVVENMDRLILNMHPKHKKRQATNSSQANGKSKITEETDENDRKRRMFPGLAIKDQGWQPPDEKPLTKDAVMKEVDDLMAQLEGVREKAKAASSSTEVRDKQPNRRSRSRSPRRRSVSPNGRRDEGRRDYRGRTRRAEDERPVLYKIYDGRVSSLKDFGAFVQLEGVMGRVEGMSTFFSACITSKAV